MTATNCIYGEVGVLAVHLTLFALLRQTYMVLVPEAQCRLPRHADVKAVISLSCALR